MTRGIAIHKTAFLHAIWMNMSIKSSGSGPETQPGSLKMHLRSLATSETLWFSASPLQRTKRIVGICNTSLTEQIGVAVKH
jgi:hypothetical protein